MANKNVFEDIRISVIIPVYNDEEGLAGTLESLMKQSFPREKTEIIVIDNGSSDRSIAVAESFPEITVISEKEPGSYAARNKGILSASYPVLAFLDAECITHKDWLLEGANALGAINCNGLVGGKIEFTFHKQDKPNIAELYDSLTYLDNKKNTAKNHFAVTANMFTSKKVFEQVGLFNSTLKSGGDREWGERVFNAGMQVVFSEKALNYHHARRSIKELITKARRVISGEKVIVANKPTFLNMLIPPFSRMISMLKNKNVKRTSTRIRLASLIYFFKLVGAFELIRLSIGYDAERK